MHFDPEMFGAAMGDLVREAVEPLHARIAELERQLAESAIQYTGVYETGRQYKRGQMATYAGSVWHCDAPTTGRPGDSDCWTLAVKRGADGRDAR